DAARKPSSKDGEKACQHEANTSTQNVATKETLTADTRAGYTDDAIAFWGITSATEGCRAELKADIWAMSSYTSLGSHDA
ncbi:MAG: hypothetical protein WB041_19660, partial [Pseudolabrys sp.]